MMQSFRKIWNKPRPDDWMPLSRFYYADAALNDIASELDSFDGRRDPDRCNALVTRLRLAQDRVLHIITEMLVHLYPRESERACRDFRVKFPDEILHDALPGQLWFGAECLAAGSNIIDHESESDLIRPLAKELTKQLDLLRDLLKNQSLRDPSVYNPIIKENLLKFDRLFAEFEYQYVSAMVPVKSVKEHDAQLDVAVLFSEVLALALEKELITQDQIDYCDPSVMIGIPRLGIVWGLLIYSEGALNVDDPPENLSEMFRPFYSLLIKIRNLLRILSKEELTKLEIILCRGETVVPESASSALTMTDFRTGGCEEENNKNSRIWMCDMPEESTNSVESSSDESPTTSPELSITDSESDENINVDNSEEEEEENIQTKDASANTKVKSVAENLELSQLNYANSGLMNNDSDCSNEAIKNDNMTSSNHKNLRARFRSSDDLVHRLFVCISGVADQLQTNYSSEIRKVLKIILQPSEVVPVYEVNAQIASTQAEVEETGIEVQEALPLPAFIGVRWVPDEDCEQCTACSTPFNFVRRRHHCRNCGRIFCNRCSCNSICIPEHGYDRKVRVCNLCYVHRLNPFGCNDQNNAQHSNEQRQTSENATSS